MKAIIPLKIKGLRVSAADASQVTVNFKGRVGHFENLPYNSQALISGTGDNAMRPLENENPPLATLQAGIHLHWELPDFFRKGIQSSTDKEVRFPQAPNRWLVIRYLSRFNEWERKWDDPTPHSWIVESDFISSTQLPDNDGIIRPSVPVPLPSKPMHGQQPYRYMGRVVKASNWTAVSPQSLYLKDFENVDGTPCYLNALGFLGPDFSSYYPDCCSVFGFWDHFADDPEIYEAVRNGIPLRFKANYQVIGWIEGSDPFDNPDIENTVRQNYQAYLARWRELNQNNIVDKTPVDFFMDYALENFGWQFNEGISFSRDSQYNMLSIDLPAKTICNGILQEIIWDTTQTPGSSRFLGNPDNPSQPAIWKDEHVRLAIGNTSAEALSALLKSDISGQASLSALDHNQELENSYEYLLNMLQTGRIEEVDNGSSNLISLLEQGSHSDSFAAEQGGLLWVVQQKNSAGDNTQPAKTAELPAGLTGQVNLLNRAQKAYDTARQALVVERKQLYMDWNRYVKKYAGEDTSVHVDRTTLGNFILQSLNEVVHKGNITGVLSYYSDSENQAIKGVYEPSGTHTKAYDTWSRFNTLRVQLQSYSDWELLAIPAPAYQCAADPVLTVEVNKLDCSEESNSGSLRVRTTRETIEVLEFDYEGMMSMVHAVELPGYPGINNQLPYYNDIQKLITESVLLLPGFAGQVLQSIPNVEPHNFDILLESYKKLLGGLNPQETPEDYTGLFEKIRQEGYIPEPNPILHINMPVRATVVFRNHSSGLANITDETGWNKQECCSELHPMRYDPFIPVSLIWSLTLEPLKHELWNGKDYDHQCMTSHFMFNDEATDYIYGNYPFSLSINYKGASALNRSTVDSLTQSIEKYAAAGTEDITTDMQMTTGSFGQRKIVSLTLNGFNSNEILRFSIPGMNIVNMTHGPSDTVTNMVREATLGNSGDSWFDHNFNTEAPIYKGLLAQDNFGPLRSGFLSVLSLEVVDVFGQRMRLSTQGTSSAPLQLTPSMSLSPKPEDVLGGTRAYLPPRLLTPARLFFRWLHPSGNVGSQDAIEVNPETSIMPVCGWVVPNNFNFNLFFYDSDGTAIGSFGLEGTNLKYRTRIGNPYNASDSLEADIGTPGNPTINAHLARFMWYIETKSGNGQNNGGFISDLMQVIRNSDGFISTGNGTQNASLAILMGTPLALVRTVIGMETFGATLPLNQADTNSNDPWPNDIMNNRYDYTSRTGYSSANLGNVEFPARLGDLYNMDDGLIGYIRENQNAANPYGNADFYAPAAPEHGQNGVVKSSDTSVRLTLNAGLQAFTMLVDPRASIHVTTAVLPIEKLTIPYNQYDTMVKNLQMTFFTHPLLKQNNEFSVPLPEQSGYEWSWVNQEVEKEIPLKPSQGIESGIVGYTPQTIEEGWLKLSSEAEEEGENE